MFALPNTVQIPGTMNVNATVLIPVPGIYNHIPGPWYLVLYLVTVV